MTDINVQIGKRIRNLRKEQKMSAAQFASLVGIGTATTLTRYETGARTMNPETIDRICKYFGKTADYFFNEDLPTQNQAILIKNFDTLQLPRQQKVLDYLTEQVEEQRREESKSHYYAFVLGEVSAGTGQWLHEELPERIEVDAEPPAHDFAVRVIGDSMMPLFSDGEVIFVKKVKSRFEVRNNQIIIAELNGNAYVKKVTFEDNQAKLISLNDKYEDIIVTESDDFSIPGVVVM